MEHRLDDYLDQQDADNENEPPEWWFTNDRILTVRYEDAPPRYDSEGNEYEENL